jgi:hypothetical protein
LALDKLLGLQAAFESGVIEAGLTLVHDGHVAEDLHNDLRTRDLISQGLERNELNERNER